jgi:hypothetical protein
MYSNICLVRDAAEIDLGSDSMHIQYTCVVHLLSSY